MPDKSTHQIEQDIAADRAALDHTIEELMGRLTPGALADQAGAYLAANGESVIDTVARRLRENPVGAGLAGVGLAWLAIGPGNGRKADLDRPDPVAEAHVLDPTGFDARVRAADRAIKKEISHELENEMTDLHDNTDNHIDKWTSLKAKTRIAKARAYRRASELRDQIDEGTTGMSDQARTRVRKARAAAIAAQERAEEMVSRASRDVRVTAQDHPLLVGAAAFVAGAALGAALPRTETEDRAFGSYRDRMFDEAERVFREEVALLKQSAQAAAAESQEILEEKLAEGQTALRDATSRIAERVEDETAAPRKVARKA